MITGSDPDRALEENIGIMAKPIIRRYNSPAGGWGALEATGKALADQGIALSGSATLLKVNQPVGFDCPGCAWPDPKHTSAFEFCENGAKAVAWEATAKRCTPEFFAAHTLEVLRKESDLELEMEGRLTHPLAYDHTSDKYVPVSWADALDRIGAVLRSLETPDG
jgi:anaerobic selenocysteine-containing dehydrogenase